MAQGGSVYIYALCDPKTHAIRYVGRAGDLVHRLRGHNSDRRPSHKVNWMRQLDGIDLMPFVQILEETTEEDWPDKEREWIEVVRQIGEPLTNMTTGGDGLWGQPGWSHADETKAKISLMKKGVKQTPEHAAASAAARRGVTHKRKPETIAKYAARFRSPEYRAKMDALYADPEFRKRHAEATRAAMIQHREAQSARSKALWADPEWRAMMVGKIKLSRGFTQTPEFRAKQSAVLRGKKHKLSPEGRKNIASAQRATRLGKPGRRWSEEEKAQISARNKGRTGHPISEWQRQRISEFSRLPKKPETKAKIAEKARQRWANPEWRDKQLALFKMRKKPVAA